jgi:regulator of replication initiation timing
MPHELPPHFHAIKADEARHFANQSSPLHTTDLEIKVLKLEMELRHAKIEIAELRHQIRETIMENLHLADGDKCTLRRLKDAISFKLEDYYENETSGGTAARNTP